MTILLFLAVLVALILVHEFGHFIVAKRSGIRVDEFGIGFPPRLYGKQVGETLYSINALPFGGFVRIYGENPGEVSGDEKRAFISAPRLTQAAVLFAGVFFNILFAWVLLSGTLIVGTPAIVGAEQYREHITNERVEVTATLPGSPAVEAGVLPGDEIVSITISGVEMRPSDAADVGEFISSHPNEETILTVRRGGETLSLTMTPEKGVIEGDPELVAVGVGVGLVWTLKLPVYLAAIEGAKQTVFQLYNVGRGIFSLLFDALLLRADLSSVAGPVGIVSLVGSASALGLVSLLNFVALISLNLAVINMIPFPALDGGRLLFLAIESIKGSAMKPRVAEVANLVGFALLILLMLAVTYNDVARLIG